MSGSSSKVGAGRFVRRLALGILVAALVVAGADYALRVIQPVAIVEPVVSGPAIDAKAGSVTVSEEYSMDLKSELGGRLLAKDFNLEPGNRVNAGQILAQLDATDLRLALQRSQIDFTAMEDRFKTDRTDELNLEAAKKDLANYRIELSQGRISQADYDKRELAYRLEEQGEKLDEISRTHDLAAARNGLEIQRNQIGKMTVRAPFDGVIKAVYAHPGDLIGAGTPIATLITLKKVVKGEISDEDFARIRPGQSASVIFIPYGNFIFGAKVTKILPTADPATQRHMIYLDVDIDPAKLVPGISGEVSVVVARREARTIVPRRAVFSYDGDSVYVVRDGVVRRRSVVKGFVWAKGVEILQGLEPGEQVIVEGLEDYRDGERVRTQLVPSDVWTKVK
ncbi:MAG: efflux RND transporter periplasmic adaptor subunit [Opitutaceae bacterium]